MAKTNADLAFMAGSEKDTFYLGPKTDLSSVTLLSSDIPEALKDVGWLTEEGITVSHADSVDKIRGHQGHGVVRTYMSESSTTVSMGLYESHLEMVKGYLGASKVEKVSDGGGNITAITANPSRVVVPLSGVADIFDVSTGKQRRYVFPHLEMGERADISYKVGELTVYEYNLEVLGEYHILTNEDGMAVA